MVKRSSRWFRLSACACGLLLLVLGGSARAAAAEPLLFYRLFLHDGSTLVTFGEFARVADRVVFSIPVGAIGAADASGLQLVSIAESVVDWARTDEYTTAVRARQFEETHGPSHFALLGHRVTEALGDIRLTPDPARQLSMAEEARGNLARWPAENFGYRATEVAGLVDMLDEVISELRISAGHPGFDLRLAATTGPAPSVALLPPPDLRESLELAAAAARLAAEPSERISLLRAIAAALRGHSAAGGWAAALSRRVAADLATERRMDRQYQELVTRTIALAAERAARADARGIEALTRTTLRADDRLGRRRPHDMAALLAYLDLKLEEARELRLAREAWIARRALFEEYRRTIVSPLRQLRQSAAWLESVRNLRRPAPAMLDRQEQRTVMARRVLELVEAPAELASVHALYNAAFHMARRAASICRTAASSDDTRLAWDASSAAAGALMLLAQADEELGRLIAAPAR